MASFEENSISFGPWGGSGGNSWTYQTRYGINGITIHVKSTRIQSISFSDTSGDHSETFGGNNNAAGERTDIPIQWPSEYLTSISGTYGINVDGITTVRSLSFITNLTTHGPYGTTSGTSFSVPTMENSVIVGFQGRCGWFLDSLGIFAKPDFLKGTITNGPWGGPGGDPWSFIATCGINRITISSDSNKIAALTFGDTGGSQYGKFGGEGPADIPVTDKTIGINCPSEYLTSITGFYGNYLGHKVITSLSIITNQETYGPYGKASDVASFSLAVDDQAIVGFHGRAGYFIDAIGTYLKPINI